MNPIKIPVYRPDLGGNEKKYVMNCLDSTWISSKGEYIEKFEENFRKRVGTEHATSVCNGTVALHLAMVSLGIGQGDEVIVPTFTYIASANSITYTGAIPVFADSCADTWQLDPEDVERRITPRTKAIMAVHLYGHSCNMAALQALAKRHRLFLIEDCAEAIGTIYRGQHVGTFGDISTFSFFGNKTITTGEGGMVVSNDKTIIERARHFKGQGLASHREYWHDVVGYNFRMTNICAAIGLAQLERLDEFLTRKQQIAGMYKSALDGHGYTFQASSPDVENSYWMVSVAVSNPAQREPLRRHLAQAGIETRPTFYPVHTMPMYSSRYQKLPIAENLAWRGINLPSFPSMRDEEVTQVCETILEFQHN